MRQQSFHQDAYKVGTNHLDHIKSNPKTKPKIKASNWPSVRGSESPKRIRQQSMWTMILLTQIEDDSYLIMQTWSPNGNNSVQYNLKLLEGLIKMTSILKWKMTMTTNFKSVRRRSQQSSGEVAVVQLRSCSKKAGSWGGGGRADREARWFSGKGMSPQVKRSR